MYQFLTFPFLAWCLAKVFAGHVFRLTDAVLILFWFSLAQQSGGFVSQNSMLSFYLFIRYLDIEFEFRLQVGRPLMLLILLCLGMPRKGLACVKLRSCASLESEFIFIRFSVSYLLYACIIWWLCGKNYHYHAYWQHMMTLCMCFVYLDFPL